METNSGEWRLKEMDNRLDSFMNSLAVYYGMDTIKSIELHIFHSVFRGDDDPSEESFNFENMQNSSTSNN